jgi:hypothetical protein
VVLLILVNLLLIVTNAILPFILALILDSALIVAAPQIPRFIPDLPGVK